MELAPNALTLLRAEHERDAAAPPGTEVSGRTGMAEGHDRPLGRIGPLTVSLASCPAEIEAIQRLRFDVFVKEFGASGSGRESGLEADALDRACDHLCVRDTDTGEIVGTYRLLTDRAARRTGGRFYSEGEFEASSLLARHPGRRFLELGRSCVARAYRDRRTIELLWQGIWAYALRAGTDVMFGCASLPGTDPVPHRGALGFLRVHAPTPAEWSIRAATDVPPGDLVDLDALAHGAATTDARRALRALPPLVKGYVRLGGRIGPHAVIDRDFRCIDVMIVLPHEAISPRYIAHYGADAGRFAAT